MKKLIIRWLDKWNVKAFEENGYLRVTRSRYKIPISAINEYISYMFGVIFGDGCLRTPLKNKKGTPRFRIQITTSSKLFFDKISDLIEKVFNYKPRFEILRGRYEMYINSSIIFAYFALLGIPIGKKIGKLRLPKVISKDKKLFLSFLAGFLDTDGHMANPSFYLYQSHRTILEEIKNALESLEIDSSLVSSAFKLNGKNYNRFYLRFRINQKTSELLKLLKHPRHLNYMDRRGISPNVSNP